MYLIIIWILITLFNSSMIFIKRIKTTKKMTKVLETKGYKVDSRFKYSLPTEVLVKFIYNNRIEAENRSIYFFDIFNWFPVLHLYLYCLNIKYLCNNYSGENDVYAYLEDACNNSDVIDFLKKEKLIIEDKEAKLWLADRNKALEELEEKYDAIEEVKEQTGIYINKNDNIDELYEKLEKLKEFIKDKENEKLNSNEGDDSKKYELTPKK